MRRRICATFWNWMIVWGSFVVGTAWHSRMKSAQMMTWSEKSSWRVMVRSMPHCCSWGMRDLQVRMWSRPALPWPEWLCQVWYSFVGWLVGMTDYKGGGDWVSVVRMSCEDGGRWCSMRCSVVDTMICCRSPSTMMFRLRYWRGSVSVRALTVFYRWDGIWVLIRWLSLGMSIRRRLLGVLRDECDWCDVGMNLWLREVGGLEDVVGLDFEANPRW